MSTVNGHKKSYMDGNVKLIIFRVYAARYLDCLLYVTIVH